MELVRGTTLRGLLERHGRIAPAVAARWFDQLLDGLAAAHEQGVIHRDLKPENVMVGGTGGEGDPVKILDFGLAKAKWASVASTGLTAPGTVLGTYAYMSPEQLGGAELDERSDLFSLAVMVVEAVTGTHPFRSRTTAETLHAILHRPVRLEGEGPEARALEGVLARALAAEPGKRFASAAELRRALIPALRALPPPA
jgi:serine/threonine-protein kinase